MYEAILVTHKGTIVENIENQKRYLVRNQFLDLYDQSGNKIMYDFKSNELVSLDLRGGQ